MNGSNGCDKLYSFEVDMYMEESKMTDGNEEYRGLQENKMEFDLEQEPFVIETVHTYKESDVEGYEDGIDDRYVFAIMIMDVVSIMILMYLYHEGVTSIIDCTDITEIFQFNLFQLILHIVNIILVAAKFILLIKDCIQLYKAKQLGVKLVLYAILFKPGYIWVRAKKLKRNMFNYYMYVGVLLLLTVWWLTDIYITMRALSDKLVGLMGNGGGTSFDPFSSLLE